MTGTPLPDLDRLRRQAAAASGAARAGALADLGAALDQALRAAGPAEQGSLRDEAVRVLAEAYQELDPTDSRWLTVAGALGRLHAVRYLTGDFAAADAAGAEAVNGRLLQTPDLPGAVRDEAHLWLGQVLLARSYPASLRRLLRDTAAAMHGGGMLGAGFLTAALAIGDAAPDPADIDAGVRHLSVAAESAHLPGPVRQMATAQLAMATAMRGLTGDADVGPALAMLSAVTRDWPAGAPGRAEFEAAGAMIATQAANQTGDPAVLAAAADGLRAAEQHLPAGHGLRPVLLDDLAVLLTGEAERTGRWDRLDDVFTTLTTALNAAAVDHPFRETISKRLLGSELARTAWRPAAGAAGAAGDLNRRAREQLGEPRDARDAYLLGMTALLAAIEEGGPDGYAEALGALREAVGQLPGAEAATVLGTVGAALADRHQVHGAHADGAWSEEFLSAAVATLASGAVEDNPGLAPTLLAMRGYNRTVVGLRRRDPARLDEAVEDLSAALRDLPDTHSWRTRAQQVLGLATLAQAAQQADSAGIARAAELLAPAGGPAATSDPDALVPEGAAEILRGLVAADPEAFRRGADQLRALADRPAFVAGQPARLRYGAGLAGLLHYELTGVPAALDQAIEDLQSAREASVARSGSVAAGDLLRCLERAYRLRGASAQHRSAAIDAGLAALAEDAAAVFLQTGAADGLRAARGVADYAQRIALDCLAEHRPEAAVTALELGRGLVVYAATATTGIPDLLHAADRPDLADAWAGAFGLAGTATASATPSTAPAAAAPGPPASGDVAELARAVADGLVGEPDPVSGLRIRVLAALAAPDTDLGRSLFAPYDPEAVQDALRTLGRTALVYLIPGVGDGSGWAVLLTATGGLRSLELPGLSIGSGGPIDAFLAAQDALDAQDRGNEALRVWDQALEQVCDWVGPVVLEPVLAEPTQAEPHLTLVPCGPLGMVPWHAARLGGLAGPAERACQRATFSYAATARQLVEAATRPVLALNRYPVLVGPPGRDLPGAEQEVTALQQCWYRGAPRYGDVDAGAGIGRPDEILEHLPGARPDRVASLLHLGCHAVAADPPTASYLELASPEPDDPAAGHLTVDRMLHQARRQRPGAAGGLVVLSACRSGVSAAAHDEGLSLATSFLAAGAASVVASLWDVPDLRTGVLMYVLHDRLQAGLEPPAALRAAQLWMLDPDRKIPEGMDPALAARAGSPRLAALRVWAAFACLGR